MRNLIQATLYPGIGAIEGTNVSVGRGTDTPFEQVGAPWIDGVKLAELLNARALAGDPLLPGPLHADRRASTPDEECQGVFMIVTDRVALHPVRVGLEIAAALQQAVRAEVRPRGDRAPARIQGEHRPDPRRR